MIHGVPAGTQVDVVGDDHFKFTTDTVEVRVQANKKIISIMHLGNFQQTLIDLNMPQISLPPGVIERFEEGDHGRWFFEDQSGEYEGELRHSGESAQVILEVDDLAITIDF